MIDFIENNWIEIIGAITGLIYLYYEYKADTKMWPAGIVMSSFYTVVFIQAKFYAFACINIYYILAAIYGWLKWRKVKPQKDSDKGIINTPKKLILPIAIATIAVYLLVLYILMNHTDSPVPYGDSFVTALSIIAMWMLAHKFVEQWLLVIILNAFSIFLYFFQDLYPTSAMYLIYTIVSIFGYFRWKRMVVNKLDNEKI